MTQPSFFLVGAPRCGTTALSGYLREHPNVFLSTPKEPHFFATDLPGFREVRDQHEYEQLFSAARPMQWRVGEASVFYLLSQEATWRVKQYAPHARILIMVRDPLELVASFHAHLVFTRNEDQPRLAAAWKLRSRRREGLSIPAECRDAKVLQYDQIARLGEQTERWLHLFGEEQVKVIYFDDFVADTARVYREVLEFLGLPDDHRSSFPVVNARRRQRLDAVANFTERTPEALVRIAMAAKRLLGLEAWGVLDALRRWNSAPSNPETIDTQTEREITEAYRSDVSRLATLTGRDCESWFDRPRTDRGLRGELRKSCAVAPPT